MAYYCFTNMDHCVLSKLSGICTRIMSQKHNFVSTCTGIQWYLKPAKHCKTYGWRKWCKPSRWGPKGRSCQIFGFTIVPPTNQVTAEDFAALILERGLPTCPEAMRLLRSQKEKDRPFFQGEFGTTHRLRISWKGGDYVGLRLVIKVKKAIITSLQWVSWVTSGSGVMWNSSQKVVELHFRGSHQE